MEERSGALGRGGFSRKIGASSVPSILIPRMQARPRSFFSGKGFGVVLGIDSLINKIVQSLFCGKDAA